MLPICFNLFFSCLRKRYFTSTLDYLPALSHVQMQPGNPVLPGGHSLDIEACTLGSAGWMEAPSECLLPVPWFLCCAVAWRGMTLFLLCCKRVGKEWPSPNGKQLEALNLWHVISLLQAPLLSLLPQPGSEMLQFTLSFNLKIDAGISRSGSWHSVHKMYPRLWKGEGLWFWNKCKGKIYKWQMKSWNPTPGRSWHSFSDHLHPKLEGFCSGFPVAHLQKSGTTTSSRGEPGQNRERGN